MQPRGAADVRTAAEIKPVEPETDNAGAGIGKTPICARLLLDAARMPKRRSKKNGGHRKHYLSSDHQPFFRKTHFRPYVF